MVLETPIKEKHGSFNNIWYKLIPRNNDIYMPIGTTIEVSERTNDSGYVLKCYEIKILILGFLHFLKIWSFLIKKYQPC